MLIDNSLLPEHQRMNSRVFLEYPNVGELLSKKELENPCLLYTSDAADDSLRVDLGGRRIIKKRHGRLCPYA